MREPGGQSVGTTRMGANHTRDAFGEDAPRAGVVVTEETASLQTELNGDAAPGQIGQGAEIAAVDKGGWLSTERTPRL